MIQANELRIGNYIYDVHNRVANIVTIGNGTIRLSSKNYHYDSFNCSDINPIPLTEDILLKCGKKELDLFIIGDYYYSKGSLLMSSYNDGEPDIFLAKVDTLHHLQNIIFALTGEELNVEL